MPKKTQPEEQSVNPVTPVKKWPWDEFRAEIDKSLLERLGVSVFPGDWEEPSEPGTYPTYQKNLLNLVNFMLSTKTIHLLALDNYVQMFEVHPSGSISIFSLSDGPGMKEVYPRVHNFTETNQVLELAYHMKLMVQSIEAIHGEIDMEADPETRLASSNGMVAYAEEYGSDDLPEKDGSPDADAKEVAGEPEK